jgi:hypothetical protein
MQTCGRPKKDGNPCGWRKNPCPVHQEWPRPQEAAPAPVQAEPVASRRQPPEAIVSRDLHELAWWAMEALIAEKLDPGRASALATVMRALHALGEAPEGDEQRWERIALEARLANGLPPADEEGWAVAERVLDPETLAEIRQWA